MLDPSGDLAYVTDHHRVRVLTKVGSDAAAKLEDHRGVREVLPKIDRLS